MEVEDATLKQHEARAERKQRKAVHDKPRKDVEARLVLGGHHAIVDRHYRRIVVWINHKLHRECGEIDRGEQQQVPAG